MFKAHTWFSLCILSLGTVAATASCGSDEATGGTGGVSGGGLIGNAGRAGGVSRAGAGGGAATGTGMLGGVCDVDADCGAGFTCLTPDSTVLPGGGPANGLCTKACANSTECAAIQAGAECFELGTAAASKTYCLAGCEQGSPAEGDEITKCQGRGDVACIDVRDPSLTSTPETFCYPLCRADVECGTGLFCNKASGLCSKTKQTGDALGTPCTPDAAIDSCEGFCLQTSDTGVTPVEGVCAELCAGVLPCGYTESQPGGLCLGPLSATFGFLDLGYCLPNCSCTGECLFSDDVCRAWSSSESGSAELLGAPGLCYPTTAGSTALAACAGGGAGGVSGASGAGGDVGVTPSAGAAGDSSLNAGAGGTSGAAN